MTYRPYHDYPSRTICEILSEIRKLYECRNFAGLLGLAEEIQSKANRMEAALEGMEKIKEIEKKRQEAKDELRKLEQKIVITEAKLEKLNNSGLSKSEKKQLKQEYKDTHE